MKKLFALTLFILILAGCAVLPGSPDSSQERYSGWFEDYITAPVGTFCMYNTSDQIPYNLSRRCTIRLYAQLLNDSKDGYYYAGDLAQSAPVCVDALGTEWIIELRRGCKWQNGVEITADDFIYSMQQLLDPKSSNRQATIISSSAYAPIKNASEYFLGKCDWSDVGIEKIGDYSLRLTTARRVTPELLMRTFETPYTMLVYKPLYEQYRNSNGISSYGTAPDRFMSAGPFFLTSWDSDSKYTFTVNPDYTYSDLYHIEGINVYVVPNSATATELFLGGKLDYLSITYAEWEMFEEDPRTYEFWGNSLQYMFINLGNPSQNGLLGNINFRKALYYAADRVSLSASLGGIPATRLVRKAVVGNPDTGTAFVDMPGSMDYIDDGYTVQDIPLANEYLTRAFEQCSLDSASMEIYYSDSSTHSKIATEILHLQYLSAFGGKLSVPLRMVPASQQFNLRRWDPQNPTSFETTIGSVTPLADSPHYTFQYYISTYSPPRFCYSNSRFDEIYQQAAVSQDSAEVTVLCQQLEKILLDDLVVIPLYEIPSKALFSERVTLPAGKFINNFGFGYELCTISK